MLREQINIIQYTGMCIYVYILHLQSAYITVYKEIKVAHTTALSAYPQNLYTAFSYFPEKLFFRGTTIIK